MNRARLYFNYNNYNFGPLCSFLSLTINAWPIDILYKLFYILNLNLISKDFFYVNDYS